MNKCCKTCKNFKDEDADGYGWCELQQEEVTGYFSYPCHEPLNNGWTEITPDNVEELKNFKRNRVVICAINSIGYMYPLILANIHIPLDSIAKYGGSYYYVLPELKIE